MGGKMRVALLTVQSTVSLVLLGALTASARRDVAFLTGASPQANSETNHYQRRRQEAAARMARKAGADGMQAAANSILSIGAAPAAVPATVPSYTAYSHIRGGLTSTGEGPPSNCYLADPRLMSMRESDGFFCDDDPSWQIRKQIAKFQQPNQERTSPWGMAAFYQENWEPNFSCGFERRVGEPGDGGKWVCDPHRLRTRKDCLIYSFGSENKFDFEYAVRNQIGEHCEIHTFDHTIGTNPSNRPAFVQFHPWGIGPDSPHTRPDHNVGVKSLKHIVELLGHSKRQVSVLKMDVEGAEFEALPPLLEDGTFERLKVQQILLEVHKSDPQTVHRLLRAFHKANYVIFHKEPNIQYPMSHADVCVEYAFIKVDASFWS